MNRAEPTPLSVPPDPLRFFPAGRYWRVMRETKRPLGWAALLFGLFVAVQTFVLLARRDRWEVLFFFSRETALLVALLWLRDVGLAAAAGVLAGWILRKTLEAPERETAGPEGLHPGPGGTFLLFAVAAAGLPLRWIASGFVPPGLWVDIPYETLPVLLDPARVRWSGATPFVTGGMTHEVLSNSYLAYARGVYGLFGRTDLGFLALSALPGCLTPLAVFWLARELYGRRVALLALALAGVASWPLIVARWGSVAALNVPLVLGAAAATLAARRTGRAMFAALAGGAVGLSLHTHTAAWAVAPLFALFTIGALRRKDARKLVLVGWLVAGLTAAPFVVPLLSDVSRLGGHVRDVHLGKPVRDVAVPRAGGVFALPVSFGYNALEYTGLPLFTRDPNPRHVLPGRGVVLPLLGAAALVGAAGTVRRAAGGEPREILLLLVSSGMLAAGILSDPGGAPNTFRTCALAGPILIWSAVAAVRWSDRWEATGRVRGRILLPAVVALTFVSETVPFFAEWPFDPRVKTAFGEEETAAGRQLRRLGIAPRVLDPGALRHPLVLEVLSGPADARIPLPRLPLRTPAGLVGLPPGSPFWYVSNAQGLGALRSAGWKCARGIATSGEASGIVIAWTRPPRSV
jgi:hypothetical protein